MDRCPVGAKVVASVEEGFYGIDFELDRDEREKIHALSSKRIFTVDGGGDSGVCAGELHV